MKKLKKTLALVLALVMIISVFPLASNADDTPSGAIVLSKVNGVAYDSGTPIRCGDTISFDVSISRDASAAVKAWAVGFSFDTNALVLSGITWGTAWSTYGSNSDKGSYIQLGSVSTSNVTNPSEVVATLNFKVDAAFTGESTIATNLGSNYIGISTNGVVNRTNISVTPATFTVYSPIDKTALKEQIDIADALTQTDYIPVKWAVLASALENAKSIYGDAYTSQTKINSATQTLKDAIAGLEKAANKMELQKAVNSANIELSKTCYTAESVAALKEAVKNATAVLNDENAVQATVDEQLSLVNTAISNLKFGNVTVTFLNEDGTVFDTQSVPYGGDATVPEGVPTKASDETYNYVFNEWNGTYTNVTADTQITPSFTRTYIEYTIIFEDEDGTPLSSSDYHYGDTVTPPTAPTKAQDDVYTYSFAGWTPEVDFVKEAVTYKATYSSTYREYTVKFVNYDNAEISSANYHWGDTVNIPEETPVKPADFENSYEFAGWSPAVVAVAGNATYVAMFYKISNLYTVKFVNYDDSVISEKQYSVGETITVPTEVPTKPSDETYYYTYKGWDQDVVMACAGNATYKATFDAHYLDANYDAVEKALDDALAVDVSNYTSVSYARVTTAMGGVVRGLTIDRQDEVDTMAKAINDAISALVSTTSYDKAYTKCASVNNSSNQFTAESYQAFLLAMEAIGTKKNFNTEEATQAQVDEATTALDDAYSLLQAATLSIDGAKEVIYNGDAFVIAANTNANTTTLVANDGGANISTLKFYDKEGNEITNKSQSIGTGCTVKLLQNGEVKLTKIIIVYGDINGDGQVSIADIALGRKYATNPEEFTVAQDLAALCSNETFNINTIIDLAKAI